MVMYAREIMTELKETVSGQTTLLQATQLMVVSGTGFLIVMDGKRTGIVTEWDIVKAVAGQTDLRSTHLKDVMRSPVMSVTPDTPTDVVASMMAEKGIRRLLVEEDGKIIGVITSKDILRIFRRYVDEVTAAITRFRPF
ncbi:MAG: CBS domain-containing protein [Methanomassiliicoccales archaeon]